MSKKEFKLAVALLQCWYEEFEALNYAEKYPYHYSGNCGRFYELHISPDTKDFCSSVLMCKIASIADALNLSFHVSYVDGLVFTLH